MLNKVVFALIAFALFIDTPVNGQFNRKYKVRYPFYCSPVPNAPNYENPDDWAALPDRKDLADITPSPDIINGQDSAKADVFYIHPTTYFKGDPWNASIEDKKLNAFTDKMPVMHQATAFNGSCKIYAPRYRQAHLRAFFTKDSDGLKALDLAYGDIKLAFEYYLKNYNHGRPIVIAGHSQGAWLAIKLVKDYFDGKPLQHQLVSAYLVGMPFKASQYQVLKPCHDSLAIGCYVAWATFAKGYHPKDIDSMLQGDVMINPLTWTSDTVKVSANHARGTTWLKFKKVYKKAVSAQISNGMLWIDQPKGPFYLKLMRIKIWHVADYNLFWMDIRHNVRERVNTWLATNHSKG